MRIAAVEFTARFQSVIWAAEDGSAVIASTVDSNGGKHVVKGALGAGPSFQSGLAYRFHGSWERHEKHGEQFVFATYSAVLPHDRRGIIVYLVSIAENVGEKRAERLWDIFGSDAVEVLRKQPERVVEAGIMTADAAAEASQSLHDEAAFEHVKIDLLGMFAGRGFQAAKLIPACLQRWGARAAERVRHNPYLLLAKRLPSAGFNRCDRLYLDMGGNPRRLKRQALCAWNAIRSDSTGHTWFPGENVARDLIAKVSGAEPVRALRLALRGKLLAKHKDATGVWLAENRKAHNEAIVADKVKEMIAA